MQTSSQGSSVHTILEALINDYLFVQVVDVASASEIAAVIEESFHWRPIDVLVCNAGIAKGGYLEDVSISDLEMQYHINLLGSIYPVHAALPLLKPRSLAGHPTSIVFINSLCSLVTYHLSCSHCFALVYLKHT